MTEAKPQTVLRRKAEAGRPPPEAAPMSAPRAVGLALAKCAQDMLALPLRVAGLNEQRMTLADLPEALQERSLLAVIEGPGEALGLIALPPATLSALIEVQTMGRLAPTPPPARKPTRTDAAMTAGLVDGFLTGFEAALSECDEIIWAGGFRYASFLDDPRPLGLLLEDVAYRVFEVRLVLGAGRQGGFLLALPATGRGPGPCRQTAAAAAGSEAGPPAALAEGAAWPEQMERVVMGAQAVLEAVLHRATLPLQAVLSFQPGLMIPLPMAALEQLSIEGAGRRIVARGRLGQNRGFRAVRLTVEGAEVGASDPVAAAPAAAPPRPVGAPAPQRGTPMPIRSPLIPPAVSVPPIGLPEDGEDLPGMPMKMGTGS